MLESTAEGGQTPLFVKSRRNPPDHTDAVEQQYIPSIDCTGGRGFSAACRLGVSFRSVHVASKTRSEQFDQPVQSEILNLHPNVPPKVAVSLRDRKAECRSMSFARSTRKCPFTLVARSAFLSRSDTATFWQSQAIPGTGNAAQNSRISPWVRLATVSSSGARSTDRIQ